MWRGGLPLRYMRPAAAFDLEFDRLAPTTDGEWQDARTRPRITCAAACTSDGYSTVWKTPLAHGTFAPQLSVEAARALVLWLWQCWTHGYDIVTWGGSSSDWRALVLSVAGLADADDLTTKCTTMAMAHVDVPLAAAATMGTMMGLDACARGMNLGGKAATASVQAPLLWLTGLRPQQQQVLAHVAADAHMTLLVYSAAVHMGTLQWMSRKGQLLQWAVPIVEDGAGGRRLANVAECLGMPPTRVPFQAPPAFQKEVATAWLTSLVARPPALAAVPALTDGTRRGGARAAGGPLSAAIPATDSRHTQQRSSAGNNSDPGKPFSPNSDTSTLAVCGRH